jgi:hypothetical protein
VNGYSTATATIHAAFKAPPPTVAGLAALVQRRHFAELRQHRFWTWLPACAAAQGALSGAGFFISQPR